MKLMRALTVLIGLSGLLFPAVAVSAASPNAGNDGGGYPGRGAPYVSSSAAAAVAPPAGYPLGIDVSSHDHANGKTINWAAERANGVTFAYVKATEGTSYVNPYFNSDYNTAKSVGIFAGAYAFGRPDLGNPIGQADHFVNNLQWATDGMTLPPFLDMEWPYISGTPMCYGLSTSAMVSWISSFLSRVESRIGRTPMIYTNVNWWNPCTGSSSAFSRYYLDVSSCLSSPPSVPGWGSNWTVWQYDIPDCGRGATRDWDVFNGTYAQLAEFAGGAVAQSSGAVVFNGTLYEFARGADGTVKYWFANGGPWSSVQTIGGNIAGDPVATVFNGHLYVFAIGVDGTIKYWFATGGDWSSMQTLGGAVSGAVSGTVFNGVLYVFARGTDGAVKYWFANGGPWSSMQTIGGSVSGAIGTAVFNGHLYVFAVGTDGTIKYWFANGGPWSSMQTFGGPVSGGLSSSVFNGVLYVFARGTDGGLKYWFANGGPWSSMQTIGGTISGAVSSTVFNGVLYAFARGTDGTIKYWFANGGPWSSMQTIGSGAA